MTGTETPWNTLSSWPTSFVSSHVYCFTYTCNDIHLHSLIYSYGSYWEVVPGFSGARVRVSAQVGMRIKLGLFVRAVSALYHWAFSPPTHTNLLKHRFFKLLTLISVIFKSLGNLWSTKTLRKSPFPSNCMSFTCLCFLCFLLIHETVLIISIMWDFLVNNHNCSDLKVTTSKPMKERAVEPYEIIYATMFIWKYHSIKTGSV